MIGETESRSSAVHPLTPSTLKPPQKAIRSTSVSTASQVVVSPRSAPFTGVLPSSETGSVAPVLVPSESRSRIGSGGWDDGSPSHNPLMVSRPSVTSPTTPNIGQSSSRIFPTPSQSASLDRLKRAFAPTFDAEDLEDFEANEVDQEGLHARCESPSMHRVKLVCSTRCWRRGCCKLWVIFFALIPLAIVATAVMVGYMMGTAGFSSAGFLAEKIMNNLLQDVLTSVSTTSWLILKDLMYLRNCISHGTVMDLEGVK